MRFLRIPTFIIVPTLCLAVALSVGSSVSADGLASQFKARMPMRPGLSLENTSSHTSLLTPVVASKSERVLMKMRRDQRASERRIKKVAALPSEVIVIPTVTMPAPNRNRLVVKGQQIPVECQGLHTHERSSCIYASQFSKTVRAALVTQK